jgi:PST family polysaccharide transporter
MLDSALSFLKGNRKTLGNFFSLYVNNGVKYLLPLIIVPYLIKTIGVDHYGVLIFTLAFASYFKILIDFGFEMAITKQIVIYRNDPKVLSDILSFTIATKILLFLLSLVIFGVVVLLFEPISKAGIVFNFAIFAYTLSSVFNVNAFFYAFQEVRYITIVDALFKTLYLVALVVFIHSHDNMILLALLSSLSWILPAMSLFFLGLWRHRLKLVVPKWKGELNREIVKESRNAFVSSLAVSMYGTTNVFVLGLVAPSAITGIYGGVEKIFNAFTNILASANYVLYPMLLFKYNQSKEAFKTALSKMELIYFLLALGMALLMYVSQPWVLPYLFAGQNLPEANVYYNIFTIATLFSPFGAFYTRLFLVLGISSKLIPITAIGLFLNVAVFLIILVLFENQSLAPLSVLFTQIYISVAKRLTAQAYLHGQE